LGVLPMSAQPSTVKQIAALGCLGIISIVLLLCSGVISFPKSEQSEAEDAAEEFVMRKLENEHSLDPHWIVPSYTWNVEEVNPDVWRIYGRVHYMPVNSTRRLYHYVAIVERTSNGQWRQREPVSVVKQ
jgi:hypothetical protein